MMRFCRSRLITSETWSAFRRFESSPKGSAMEPDRSIRKRKHDGFLRLISAVYDILTASSACCSPASYERHRPLSDRTLNHAPRRLSQAAFLGSPMDCPRTHHPPVKLTNAQIAQPIAPSTTTKRMPTRTPGDLLCVWPSRGT